MCTPTATPPAWLIRKHPEILPVDAQGHVRNFGSRKHYDHASPIYRSTPAASPPRSPTLRAASGRRRLADRQRVRVPRHGALLRPASRDAFRVWLEARYGTLEALNHAWGNVFWSQEYTAWDQIDHQI